MESRDIRASLFVTCLVDQFAPEVGESMVRVLRSLGVQVDFPEGQTCCGQPAFNSGFQKEARDLAGRTLKVFQGNDYVVVPSGSCGAMLRNFYPELLRHDTRLHQEATALGTRVYEFSEFLVKVLGVTDLGGELPCKVTYHDACHLRRELGVISEPRALIRGVKGAELVEMELSDVCCGFGGTFSMKYADISGAILEDKLLYAQNTGTDYLIANDTGCLMHMGGALERRGARLKVMHLAQFLDKAIGG